jgi:hypothetical protein
MSQCELHFRYTPSMAKRALLASLWDMYAVYMVMSVLVGAGCVFELKSAELRPLACFGLGVIAVLWWSWLNAYRLAGHLASTMPNPEMTVKVSDTGIEFYTDDAMSRLSWPAVRSVFRFKHVWIIEQRVSRSRRPMPVAALTPEAKELIVRMVGNAGGRVR